MSSVFGQIDRCLNRIAEAISLEGLLKLLSEIERMKLYMTDEDQDQNTIHYIVSEICLEFDVEKELLFLKKNQSESEARACLFYLIENHTNLGLVQAASFFDVTHNYAYKCKTRMKNYLQICEYQPRLKRKLDAIDKRVSIYKELQEIQKEIDI